VHPGTSLQIFDIGASAGLNLVADALPRIWTGDGVLLPIDPLPYVTRRCGFDLHPVDVIDEMGARWLRACVWPGQTARLTRLDEAIAVWRWMTPRPELVAARANDVPARLPYETTDRLLAYQTVMRDDLTADERARYEAGMRAWLDALPDGQAFWIEMEVPSDARAGGPAADIVVHARGGEDFVLATCDAHPTALTVFNEAVDAFRRVVN
jgi:hypothetical protein